MTENGGGYSVVGPGGIAYGGKEERHCGGGREADGCLKQSVEIVRRSEEVFDDHRKENRTHKQNPYPAAIRTSFTCSRIRRNRAKILLWRQNLVN